MKRRMVFCFLLGGVVAVVFYRQHGFVPQHAALVGLAVAAFGYSLLRVFDTLRSAARYRVPRDQEKSQDEETMHQATEGPAGEEQQQPGGDGNGRGE